MIETALLEQDCNKSDNINKIVKKWLTPCSKLIDSLQQAV